jgi:orotidine-5'-phosphate decarboxylase
MLQLIQDNHRFLDEAGDTTFYGKGKVPIIGQDGVSFCFIIGMVKFKEPLRRRIIELQNQIISDPYFRDIPSINKKAKEGGYYFHATTDDVPEVQGLLRFYCLCGLQI